MKQWPYPEAWKEFFDFTAQEFDCSSCKFCEDPDGECGECWGHGDMFEPKEELTHET